MRGGRGCQGRKPETFPRGEAGLQSSTVQAPLQGQREGLQDKGWAAGGGEHDCRTGHGRGQNCGLGSMI